MKVNFTTPCRTALAALAFSGGAAHAQSSVTIDGWLDAGIMKKTGGSTQVGTPSRNNIAFSGVEDLGDGFAATFRLSTRFELDTGEVENSDQARPFWKGESTVGLKGKFGSLRLGRALTPLQDVSYKFDPWGNFERIASLQWWHFAPDFLSDPQTREYARLNNGIFYNSPDFGGFSARASFSPEKNDATDRTRSIGGSFNYDSDTLSLMLGFERNSQNDKALFVGASYAIGDLTLMGGYNHVKLDAASSIFGADWTNWAGASDPKTKRTSVQVGATYALGLHTLRAGFSRDFQGSTNGFNYIGSTFDKAGTGYSGPSNMASLGYSYALSKRTSLYANVSTTRWKETDDEGRRSASGYDLGMTHSF